MSVRDRETRDTGRGTVDSKVSESDSLTYHKSRRYVSRMNAVGLYAHSVARGSLLVVVDRSSALPCSVLEDIGGCLHVCRSNGSFSLPGGPILSRSDMYMHNEQSGIYVWLH